jgi:hypothetical protein
MRQPVDFVKKRKNDWSTKELAAVQPTLPGRLRRNKAKKVMFWMF